MAMFRASRWKRRIFVSSNRLYTHHPSPYATRPLFQPSLVLVRNWITFLWLVVVGVFGKRADAGVIGMVVVAKNEVSAVPFARGELVATPPSALLLSLLLSLGGRCNDRRW
jgi:hypothetical protein